MPRSSQFRFIAWDPQSSRQPGLLARIVGFLAGLTILVVAVLVGAVFIAAFAGFMLIAAVVFMLRLWWLQRKMQREARDTGDIEAEYIVIKEERRDT